MTDTRFKPGQSGNPAGRLPGSKNRKTLAMQEFENAGPAVAAVVRAKAEAGDLHAASLILQRTDPPSRPRGPCIEFEFDPEGSVTDHAKSVMAAVAAGEVDIETGRVLMDLLSAYVGLKDVETFLSELKKLRETKRTIPGGVMTTS